MTGKQANYIRRLNQGWLELLATKSLESLLKYKFSHLCFIKASFIFSPSFCIQTHINIPRYFDLKQSLDIYSASNFFIRYSCLPFHSCKMCTCECLPSLLWVFMSEGQDVRGSAAAVAHHHRNWRSVPEVLQHYRDHIRTPFYDQCHHWHTLTDTYTWKQVAAGETGG